MKQIFIQCRLDGQVTTNVQYLTFDSENLTTKVTITYPSEYDTYTKRLDMFIGKDRTMDYKVGTTSKEFEVLLGEEHLKGGYLRLQPVANLDLGQDVLKVKWQIVEIKVKKSLNASESTADIAIPLFDVLKSEIDDLELTKMELNGSNSNVDVISFNTATLSALSQIGQLRWNEQERTLELRLSNDVTLQIGKETLLRAMNKDTTTIMNGNVCYVSGGAGTNVYVKKATNTDGLIAQSTIGVATEDLTVNESGYICTEGIVNGINTNSFEEGDILYLGTNGQLIKVEPIAPTPKIFVGVVLRKSQTQGSIYVKIRAVPRLSRLSDVYINNLQNNDVLKWNSSTLRWENKPL